MTSKFAEEWERQTEQAWKTADRKDRFDEFLKQSKNQLIGLCDAISEYIDRNGFETFLEWTAEDVECEKITKIW